MTCSWEQLRIELCGSDVIEPHIISENHPSNAAETLAERTSVVFDAYKCTIQRETLLTGSLSSIVVEYAADALVAAVRTLCDAANTLSIDVPADGDGCHRPLYLRVRNLLCFRWKPNR